MTQTDNKIQWCLKKAEKEGDKHKGLRIVAPNEAKVQEHLAKARRNLKLIDALINIEYADWAVSAIFYGIYLIGLNEVAIPRKFWRGKMR